CCSMSSAVRTSQMAYFSFQRSSTPVPYSLGNPTLNCCGGSLRTLGNMNRPVAASATADAAEKAPHASPSHARRVKSGDVSSASRAAGFAAAAAGVAARAACAPADAAVVVLPDKSGRLAGGRGGAAGRAVCATAPAAAPAAGATGAAPVAAAARAVAASSAPGFGCVCGVAAGLAPVAGALGIFTSSAIEHSRGFSAPSLSYPLM